MHFGADILNHPCFNPDIASVVSLCGHMRVSPHLVRHLSGKIGEGKISAADAAKKIGRVCKCGCFNTEAAAARLAHLAGEPAGKNRGVTTMSDVIYRTEPENFAFDFIRIPARYEKPRENGITVIADKGLGLYELKDILGVAGSFVDWLKIGFSAARVYSPGHIREKIRLCHENGVRVFMAGDYSEMSYMQGVADRYYQEVKDLGADGVEVASAEVYLPLDEKCRLVEKAAATGLQVFRRGRSEGLRILGCFPKHHLRADRSHFRSGCVQNCDPGERGFRKRSRDQRSPTL